MKITAIILILALVFGISGCAPEPDDAFADINKDTRNALVNFLASAALGSSGEYTITVDGDVGRDTVGEVTGSVSGNPSGCELVSYSFLDNTLIEVGRTPVERGKWGPLTVLYGPKALVLVQDNMVKGYWLAPQVFAMAPLTSVSRHRDFVISPRESGLVALALTHAGKYQQAADLLAALRPVHLENSGLPPTADVFGRGLSEEVDPTATAWAGYAAAILAELTDNSNLWEEARAYALYLRDIDAPEAVAARLPGWLMFSALVERYPEFGYLPEKWQPESDSEYHPLVGTWMLLAGQDISQYVKISYQPESETEKWIHYNLLAAIGEVREWNWDLLSISGGQAVTEDGKVSLEATSWMVLALSGKIR